MAAPDSTCYSPSLFVDSVPLNFTPGGGDQSVTVQLNSAALAWPNSSVSVGPVTGVDSGSVSCSIVDGSLVCNYTDGQGCPPGGCGNNGNGAVQATYSGCFPPPEPSSNPPTEPAVTPLEPSTSPPSAPSSGGREGGGGGGLPGFGPGRRVSGQHVWERTVASNSLPVNADIPWYPVYGSSPNDSPDFRFFLPPLFGFRYGASPSLLPWNGIAVYADPHGGNLEVGNSYRSNYMTPRINMSSLTRLKRTYGVSIVANGFTELVTPLDSTDTSEWGDVRYRALINTTLTEPHRTSETNYNGFRSESGTTSYVIRETLKDVDAAPQAMWWSSDEGVWSVEGFQVHTGNKGERNNRIFGGF